MNVRRIPVNEDGVFDGVSSSVIVSLLPPRGFYWLWEHLVASYDGALIADLVIACWHQADANPDIHDVGGLHHRTVLTRYPAEAVNAVPIFGGYWRQPGNIDTIRGLPPFLQMDQNQLVVNYSGAVGPADRKYQIRGLLWESSSLDDLICLLGNL